MGAGHRRRDLDGMMPGLNHPEAKSGTSALGTTRDFAGQFVKRCNDYHELATIAAAASTVVLQFDADYDGQPVQATLFGAADGTLTSITAVEWDGNGQLTITGNAAATAAKQVAVLVAGPLID